MKIPMDKPYVYALIDDKGRVFYIGKGRKYRVKNHERYAANGASGEKSDYIREVWRRGGLISFSILSTHDTDVEAGAAEKVEIASREGLLNKTPGGEIGNVLSPYDVLKERFSKLAKRLTEDGLGDSWIAAEARKEAENPTPNVVMWCPINGVSFGWHIDKFDLPERIRG